MPKKQIQPVEENRDLLKKMLMLSLFSAGVSQNGIAKRLHVDSHAVNEFLKGIKKT